MKRLQGFGESFVELFAIVRTCLTTFWFWLPVLFAAYFYVQLWMIFFVHPLTILIMPVALSIYSMIWEEKRINAQYSLEEVKVLRASDPLFTMPKKEKIQWDAEQVVREYRESLKKKDPEEENS